MPDTHILVVDTPEDGDDLQTLLLINGYIVSCASSARAARDILRRHKVDLIVIDSGVGGERDDASVVRELEQLCVPMLVITSSHACAPATHSHIARPFRLADLLEAVNNTLLPENRRVNRNENDTSQQEQHAQA
jgi:DNA-binding NtrC family response regulator